MNASVISAQSTQSYNFTATQYQQGNQQIQQLSISAQFTDTVEFGNTPLAEGDDLNVILQKSYEKLLSIVGEAKDALGIDQNSPLDTSPEATANRIADFALNFFERFAANHEELQGQEAKEAFVELIGGAIQQGISEAQDILGAVNAINGEVENNISTIQGIINDRLSAFLNQSE